MIETQFHPLDEIKLFGHTVHGLIRGTVSLKTYEVDGVLHPLPAGYDLGFGGTPGVLQIVRHPGAPAVELEPEVNAVEREAGRVWQNFALLQRSGSIFGQTPGGWIYIDADGARWLIRPVSLPLATVGSGLAIDFTIRPFGYLDEPAVEPREVEAGLAGIGQSITSPSSQRFLSLHTVNSSGSHAVLMMSMPTLGVPMGFLSVSVSGAGDEIALELSVLRTEAETLGEWSNTLTSNSAPTTSWRLAAEPVPLITGDYEFPPSGATITFTPTGVVARPGGELGGAEATVMTAHHEAGRTGRLMALIYDNADELVPLTYDTEYVLDTDYPDFDVEVSGSVSVTGTGGGTQTKPWVGTMTLDMSRSVSTSASAYVSIRRAGELVVRAGATQSQSGNQSLNMSYTNQQMGYSSLLGWTYAPFGTWSHMDSGADFVSDDAWPVSVNSPAGTDVGGALILVGSVYPRTDQQRDALGIDAKVQLLDELYRTVQLTWPVDWMAEAERLQRRHTVASSVTVAECGLVFPHAELLWRGESPPGAVYDPVGQVIATDTNTSDGLAVAFV